MEHSVIGGHFVSGLAYEKFYNTTQAITALLQSC